MMLGWLQEEADSPSEESLLIESLAVAVLVERWEDVAGFEQWPAIDSPDDYKTRTYMVEKNLGVHTISMLAEQWQRRTYLTQEQEGNLGAP